MASSPAPSKCKNNGECWYRECKSEHDDGDLCPHYEAPHPLQCPSQGDCNHRHPPECKFGAKCTNKKCMYTHPRPTKPNAPAKQAASQGPDHPKANAKKKTPSDAPPAAPAAPKKQSKQRNCAAQQNASTRPQKKDKLEPFDHALAKHDQVLAEARRRLNDALQVKASGLGVDTQLDKELRAIQAIVHELERQREVFRTVMSRADGRTDLTDKEKTHLKKREIFRFRGRLPALAKRSEIEDSVCASRITIVQGQTGSGKSTQIPQYIADLPQFAGKKVICTQPRKLAATSVATRVAFEYSGGCEKVKPYGAVRSRVGGSSHTTKRTRIEFMTEGILLEMITRVRAGADRNEFDDIGCIIIDEAHERSITCDLLLGSLKQAHPKWKHVHIVVTSATIDLDLFSGYFEGAPVVEIEGRTFPVDIQYAMSPQSAELDAQNAAAVVAKTAAALHQSNPDGDILCFLPGQQDVTRAKDVFDKTVKTQMLSSTPVVSHVLYGKQDPEEQASVFQKTSARRVIFSTDIAETSVTIDGVVFVVDSGLKKGVVFDPIRRMSALKVHTISRSSAIQRAGRAGRTRPGVCVRLYSLDDFNGMEIGDTPQILCQPLDLAILTLYNIGVSPREFDWIQPPSSAAVAQAESEMMFLGALDANSHLTPLGKLAALVQVDPRVVRMVMHGAKLGMVDVAIDLAAVLSVCQIFFWRGGGNGTGKQAAQNTIASNLKSQDGDLVSIYHLYAEWKALTDTKAADALRSRSNSPQKPDRQKAEAEEKSVELKCLDDDDEDGGDSTVMSMIQRMVSGLKAVSNAVVAETDEDIADESGSDATSEASDTLSSVDGSEAGDGADEDFAEAQQHKMNKAKRERLSRRWCTDRSINSKALGIALSTARDLRRLFEGRHELMMQTSQKSATTDDVKRMIVAGFFLNAARVKPNSREYVALQSQAVAMPLREAAICSLETKLRPQWVVFDNILRLGSQTYLNVVTPINQEWIKEECPPFYDVCKQREADLPVTVVEWTKVSAEVFRCVFGKRYVKIPKLERELQCTLSFDVAQGTIQAYCRPRDQVKVQSTINQSLEMEKTRLENATAVEQYMRQTRAVLGGGFAVCELLFGREYNSLYLRNAAFEDEGDLQRFVKTRSEASGVRSVELIQQGAGNSTGIVTFFTKQDAVSANMRLQGEHVGGQVLNVVPGDTTTSSASGSVKQAFSGRIKVSWANGIASGGGKISFPTARHANQFLRRMDGIPELRGVKAMLHGTLSGQSKDESKPPIIERVERSQATLKEVKLYLFHEEAIGMLSPPAQSKIRFEVNWASGLPTSMDEVDLIKLVHPIPATYVRVDRKPVDDPGADGTGELQARYTRLLPLLSCLDNSAVQSDFFDKAACRAGTYFYFDNLLRLEDIFLQAKESDLWDEHDRPHGQPVRMEIEYTYTTQLHTVMFESFASQIEAVRSSANERGIRSQIMHPKTACSGGTSNEQFVTLKFVASSLKQIDKLPSELEATFECERVDGVETLFSFTGRMLLQKMSSAAGSAYLRWTRHRNSVWVYGSESKRRSTVANLTRVAAELSALDEVDHVIRLDKAKAKPSKTIQDMMKAIKPPLYAYHVFSIRLYLSGSKDAIEAARRALEAENLVFKPRRGRLQDTSKKATPDCGVCYCPAEENNVELTRCGHLFCVECIEPGVTATTRFPIKCPAPDCGLLMHVNDIVKIAGSDNVHGLIESAVFDHVAKNLALYWICPKPGCNQVLSRSTITTDRAGGEFVECDNCLHEYCVKCSIEMGKPIDRHNDESCADARSGNLSSVRSHATRIQNTILSLSCPACLAVFLDFSGCTCVQCGNPSCSKYFCANCLVYTSPSSASCHDHVLSCSHNPSRSYFVSEEALAKTHVQLRTARLVEYFERQIPNDPTLRNAVFMRIRTDLMDLGIQLPAQYRGFGSNERDQVEVRYILEQLLNLRCPKCALVFADFDFHSCAALTCANPQCAEKFCAYCLAACGGDAHPHVSACELNPSRPYYFTTQEAFEQVHKQRRERAIHQYLQPLGSHKANQILQAVSPDLSRLGLAIPTFV